MMGPMTRQTPKTAKTTAPEPPAPAPLPTELLTGPRLFAAHLKATPQVWWRYIPVVVISSALAGLAYGLLTRPAALFAAEQVQAPLPGFAFLLVNLLSGIFLGLLAFGLMWGLGRLGAGRDSRPAELYGASFALLPPLWLLSIVWTLLTPRAAFQPGAEATAQAGNVAKDLEIAALHATAQTSAAFLLLLITVLGTLAQFALAFPALKESTGRTSRALLGTLLPVLPTLVVQFIGIAPLMIAR